MSEEVKKHNIRKITSYYVEVRNIDGNGTSGFDERGYLNTDGRFYVCPGPGPNCNKDFRASDIPDDVVVLVSHAQNGQLRTVAERKEVAAVAERHGFKVRRGAKA